MAAPLHRTLAAELRRRIHTGEIALGESLPSEAQLGREFSTSRGPVRQALAALRDEGLIGGGQGRRPVVLDVVPTPPFEAFLSFTLRAEISGREAGQQLQEIALRRPEPEVAAALGIEPDAMAVEVRRLRLLDGCPAALERMTYVEHVGRPLLDADLDAESIYAYLTEHGADLHAARHTYDAVSAQDEDAHLLDVDPGTPLLRERRLTWDSDRNPIAWTDYRYRPDIATVTVTNKRR